VGSRAVPEMVKRNFSSPAGNRNLEPGSSNLVAIHESKTVLFVTSDSYTKYSVV